MSVEAVAKLRAHALPFLLVARSRTWDGGDFPFFSTTLAGAEKKRSSGS
jgi:hypothetical protein